MIYLTAVFHPPFEVDQQHSQFTPLPFRDPVTTVKGHIVGPGSNSLGPYTGSKRRIAQRLKKGINMGWKQNIKDRPLSLRAEGLSPGFRYMHSYRAKKAGFQNSSKLV